jgi:hypothetical protein
MKFTPILAATIFALAVASPLVLVASMISKWSVIAIVVLVVNVAVTWGVFFLGAKVAGRPHSPKSLLFSVVLTWSFRFAIQGLAATFSLDGGLWIEVALLAVSLVFAFLAGWRFAPPIAV